MEEAEDLLCEAGDTIDNAAFDMLNALSPERIDWDMSVMSSSLKSGSKLHRFCRFILPIDSLPLFPLPRVHCRSISSITARIQSGFNCIVRAVHELVYIL